MHVIHAKTFKCIKHQTHFYKHACTHASFHTYLHTYITKTHACLHLTSDTYVRKQIHTIRINWGNDNMEPESRNIWAQEVFHLGYGGLCHGCQNCPLVRCFPQRLTFSLEMFRVMPTRVHQQTSWISKSIFKDDFCPLLTSHHKSI